MFFETFENTFWDILKKNININRQVDGWINKEEDKQARRKIELIVLYPIPNRRCLAYL